MSFSVYVEQFAMQQIAVQFSLILGYTVTIFFQKLIIANSWIYKTINKGLRLSSY